MEEIFKYVDQSDLLQLQLTCKFEGSTFPSFYGGNYDNLDYRIYVDVLSAMRSNVEKNLLCDATKDRLFKRLMDPADVKYLKVMKYEKSDATDIAMFDDDIQACPLLDCLEGKCIGPPSSGNKSRSSRFSSDDFVQEKPEEMEQVDTIVKDILDI
jgi:hypothetical protein